MLHPAALIAFALLVAAGPSASEPHVLAGARLFREDRFAEALVEFRVAERLGAPEARSYAAASLVKLGRPEEALELFEAPGAPAAGADPLLDYYHALACYDARLYLCADGLLSGLGRRSSPRIAGQAEKIRADIAAALAGPPAPDAVDWYLARARERLAEKRPVLARAFAREAQALGARRPDLRGVPEAEALLAQLPAAPLPLPPPPAPPGAPVRR